MHIIERPLKNYVANSEGQWVKTYKDAVSSELLHAQGSSDLRAVWISTRQQNYGGERYIFNFLF